MTLLVVLKTLELQIDVFEGKLRKIMKVFEVVYMLMVKTDQLTAEELNTFDLINGHSGQFGALLRQSFSSATVTPKMHMLEPLSRVQMCAFQAFGCLCDKIESAVERLHHQVN